MNNKKLYENIINNIAKYVKKALNEGLFDDEDGEGLFNTSEDDIYSDFTDNLIGGKFEDTIKNTLCKQDSYHPVIVDEEDGIPAIQKDPEDPTIYYASPYRTYRTCKFGPRKRKGYHIRYFYRYIIQLQEDGKISLGMLRETTKQILIINAQVCNFINESPYKISKLYQHTGGNEKNSIYNEEVDKLYIIDNFPKNSNGYKYSEKFVHNFPEILTQEYSEGQSSSDKKYISTVRKSDFKTEKLFLDLVKKLTSNGFNIYDGTDMIYTKKNFNEQSKKLLSGERQQELNNITDEQSKFIADQLGEEYVEKFNLIKNYIDQNNQGKFYLKTINTLRGENKICLAETILPLAVSNSLLPYEGSLVTDGRNPQINWHYAQAVMYKILYNAEEEHLNDWRNRYDLEDCCHGIDTGFGSRSIDINDTPIKILGLQSFYKLYYLIGKAIVQCEGIQTDKCMDYEMSEHEFQEYNKNKNVNMNTFEFTHLTNQLKTILDKTCKKFKIKVNKKK